MHDLGPLLWVARIGLLVAVFVHIAATVHLAAQNRAARPEAYVVDATLRASRSSRIMLWSGLTIACFVIYHLMHFTWGTFNRFYDPDGPYVLPDHRRNVYKMVIDGFSVWAELGVLSHRDRAALFPPRVMACPACFRHWG